MATTSSKVKAPQVADMVLYAEAGGEPRPAVVTKVWSASPAEVNLTTFPDGNRPVLEASVILHASEAAARKFMDDEGQNRAAWTR